MFGRNFEILTINLQDDVSIFRALKQDGTDARPRIVFTYAQSRMMAAARKKNTLLFEQLVQLSDSFDSTNSDDLNTDFQYEVITVNMRMSTTGNMIYFVSETADGKKVQPFDTAELRKLIYDKGFTITGVPSLSGDVQDIVYKPFVASASMSRQNEYLFVRQERIKPLMERISIGLVSCNDNGQFIMNDSEVCNENGFVGLKHKKDVSVSKLAAYLGLSLSDGSGMRELRETFVAEFGESALRELTEFDLNSNSVVCVDGCPDFPMPLDQLGTYVWKTKPIRMKDLWDKPPHVSNILGEKELLQLFRLFAEGDKESIRKYLLTTEAINAINAWKHYVYLHLSGSIPYNEECQLPFGEWTDLDDKIHAYCWIYALALNYRRMQQKGFCEKIAKDYVANVVTPPKQLGGYLDYEFEDAQSNLLMLYAAIDELNTACDDWETAVDTLIKIIKNAATLAIEFRHESDEVTHNNSDSKNDEPLISLSFRLKKAEPTHAACLVRPTEDDQKSELYDGVGFCDNETFDKIERLLLCKKKLDEPRRFDALIIRLPFIKGVILRMNYLPFFEMQKTGGERWTVEEKKQITIKDVFDKERRLYDDLGNPQVHMIITKSMFKAVQYFKHLNLDKCDGWVEYWNRVKKTKAELLIAQRNSKPNRVSRLNYQFLCTLGLSHEELQELAEKTLSRIPDGSDKVISSLTQREEDVGDNSTDDENGEYLDVESTNDEDSYEDDDTIIDKDIGADTTPEEECVEGYSIIEDTDKTIAEICKKNPEVLKSRYVRNLVNDKVNSAFLDAMLGRLDVSGDVRLLVPDLWAMLTYICDRFINSHDPEKLKYAWTSPINGYFNNIDAVCTKNASKGIVANIDYGHGYYYAAGADSPWISNRTRKKAVILRNPHFAVGEDALLAPLPDANWDTYDRWFGHLTGVVQVPASSLLTINGADSDGDRGNLCCDDIVVNAVERTALENTALVKKIVNNKHHLKEWIVEHINELLRKKKLNEGDKKRLQYLRHLEQWLELCMPKNEIERILFVEGYCPSLVYAGSGHSAQIETVGELNTTDINSGTTMLQERFWEVFDMTTEQKIGIMSLQALDLASFAYTVPSMVSCAEAGENKVQKLLWAWLSHWRVVNCGLDTANEIDSAKTGIRNRRHPLSELNKETDGKYLYESIIAESADKEGKAKYDFQSAFRTFRDEYKLQKNNLKKDTFDKTLKAIMNRLAKNHPVLSRPTLPLDTLPNILYKLRPKLGPYLKYEDMNKSHPEVTEFTEYFRNVTIEDNDQLYLKLRQIVKKYLYELYVRKSAREHRDRLRERYEKAFRCLLRRYPMLQAINTLDILLGDGSYSDSFVGRYLKPSKPSSRTPHQQIKDAYRSLRKDEQLSRLIWADANTRKIYYYQEIFKETVSTPTNLYGEDIMKLQEAMRILSEEEQGVYLLKAVTSYLLEAVDMESGLQNGSDTSIQDGSSKDSSMHFSTASLTPVGLRKCLEEAIMQEKGLKANDPYLTELLYNYCMTLERKNVFSDFLLIQLLDKVLVSNTITFEGGVRS